MARILKPREEKAGTNTRNTYDPPSFVKQHLARGFEVMGMELSEKVPDEIELSEKVQDVYLMRKL
jgi:hypothetical protein